MDSDRIVLYRQENGLAGEGARQMDRYGALTQQNNQTLPLHNDLDLPGRNMVIRNDIHLHQKGHNNPAECYLSTSQHPNMMDMM